MNVSPGDFDGWCAAALWMLVLAIYAARPLAVETVEEARDVRDWRTWRFEGAAAIALWLYLALPRSMTRPFYWYAVNRRLAVVVALFAILLPRGRIAGARRWL